MDGSQTLYFLSIPRQLEANQRVFKTLVNNKQAKREFPQCGIELRILSLFSQRLTKTRHGDGTNEVRQPTPMPTNRFDVFFSSFDRYRWWPTTNQGESKSKRNIKKTTRKSWFTRATANDFLPWSTSILTWLDEFLADDWSPCSLQWHSIEGMAMLIDQPTAVPSNTVSLPIRQWQLSLHCFGTVRLAPLGYHSIAANQLDWCALVNTLFTSCR